MSVLCAAVLALSGVAGAGTTVDGTEPRRLGTLVVPDLRATLAHVEAVASVVTPGAMPPGALAEGLAAKSPLATPAVLILNYRAEDYRQLLHG